MVALKRALLAAYRRHLGQTQPLVDQPTIRMLHILIAEEAEHIDLLAEQIEADGGSDATERSRLDVWTRRVELLLDAAVGVQGIDSVGYHVSSEELRTGKKTFRCDHNYALDVRFTARQVPRFLPGQEPSDDGAAGAYRWIALSRFAEMQAALGIALSIYENDDWADEVNHVGYARRNIETMMRGAPSALEGIVADINRRYAEFRALGRAADGAWNAPNAWPSAATAKPAPSSN